MLLFSLLSHTPWCCYTIIFLFLFLLFMHCNYSWVTSKYVVFITNKGTMNICVHIFVWGLKFPFFWNKFSNMWFLDHMVTTLSVERNCQNSFPSDRAILHPCQQHMRRHTNDNKYYRLPFSWILYLVSDGWSED